MKLSFADKIDDSTVYLDNTFIGRVNKSYVYETLGDFEESPDTPIAPAPGEGLGTEDGDAYDPSGWN